VIAEHLRTFLWLRWRLRVNQARKGGMLNAILMTILAVFGVLFSLGFAIGMFLVGYLGLAKANSTIIMFVWDGMVVGCVIFWMVSLINELQRSESLSLTKFLHLPVSAVGVFLVNYLSSFFTPNVLVFAPAMMALALGLALSHGPIMLLQLPLVAAFFFMMTALTYQFQGWLAALMVNPRRRRTIIVMFTMGFVLLAQLPNLANIVGGPWGRQKLAPVPPPPVASPQEAAAAQKIDPIEIQRQQAEQKKEQEERLRAAFQATWDKADQSARIVSLVLPIGWLPLGATGLADGDLLAALLGTLGLGAIGGISLSRSYRTTLRLYTGQFTSGKRKPAQAAPTIQAAQPTAIAIPATNPLEREVRWLSEQASVVALSCFRSLLRAPEGKMMLIGPVMVVVVFGTLMLARGTNPPEMLRPLMACGGIAMILFTMTQVVGNQFGLDRNGFRVFVLCPAPRREILVGKNAGIAPILLTLCFLAVIVVQVIYPMRADIFLSMLPQIISMFLLFCLLANCASILVPLRVAAGTMKPQNTKALPILAHMAFALLLPVVLAITLVPLGIQFLIEALGYGSWFPIALVLSLLECVAIAFFYRIAVGWEGAMLQWREQKILEAVVLKEE
jgi:ABC-2 type transport system permease protein